MNIETVHSLEKAVVTILNIDGWQLKWCGEGNKHYDAEGLCPEKNGKRRPCVIEMKFRKKYYPDKLLEKYKYDKLMSLDKEVVKLYFVNDPRGNYLYWLDNLNMPEPETRDIKKTTLWANDKTAKEIYLLPESKASIINYNETAERPEKSIWDDYFKRRGK
jgi:hypothetical protein